MRSLLIAILCFGVLFASEARAQGGGSNSQAAKKTKPSKQAKKRKAAQKQEFVCQLPANVTAVELSRTEVPAVCPPDNSCTQIIEVSTVAVDPGNGGLTYVYTISGGKIIGSGSNVRWDLSGVKPGTYVITVGIDEGSGWGVLGSTRTREVKVVE
ncbi:MAG TPA: hypothetical protein VK400_02005 [Pyrinomonadaceae bacterium]|nr:hypothetical protein [Pyrinomonadaceae bacterium]